MNANYDSQRAEVKERLKMISVIGKISLFEICSPFLCAK